MFPHYQSIVICRGLPHETRGGWDIWRDRLVDGCAAATASCMQNWDSIDEEGDTVCSMDADYADVQKVCDHLGIGANRVRVYCVLSA